MVFLEVAYFLGFLGISKFAEVFWIVGKTDASKLHREFNRREVVGNML